MKILEREKPYALLSQRTETLCEGLATAAREADVEVQIQSCGSMFTVFFSAEPVTDFEAAKRSDTQRFARFFQGILEEGVYLAPSQFEACFVSLAHDQNAVTQTIEGACAAFKACR